MKRFWKDVTVDRADGGWRVMLDGRPIKTQAGAPQMVPTRALAELLAAEWSAPGDEVDPAAFPARDMADYAIDMVAGNRAGTIDKLLRYAETDTLCYRADPDEPLWKRQQSVWEPILVAFEQREGIGLERASGVLHKAQPPEALAKLRTCLDGFDAFTLAALEALASLSASLTIALCAIEPNADIDALWAAAELEENWQAELWGRDWEAEERRARRTADFVRAAAFACAVRRRNG